MKTLENATCFEIVANGDTTYIEMQEHCDIWWRTPECGIAVSLVINADGTAVVTPFEREYAPFECVVRAYSHDWGNTWTAHTPVTEDLYYLALNTLFDYIDEEDRFEAIEEERNIYANQCQAPLTNQELCEILCPDYTWVVTVHTYEGYEDDGDYAVLSDDYKEQRFADYKDALLCYVAEVVKDYYRNTDGCDDCRTTTLNAVTDVIYSKEGLNDEESFI